MRRTRRKKDKLTVMMGKLSARNNGINRQFKSQIYQSRRRGQSKNFYMSEYFSFCLITPN